MTEILAASTPGALGRAVSMLRAGQLIVLPTDTVYGLAAHGLDGQAVLRLFAVKERPPEKAIALLVSGPEQVEQVAAEVGEAARRLMTAFWPGGLTLILPRRPETPVELGGRGVALRMPDHEVALRVLRAVGAPLAATSANLSGGPDPRTAGEAARQIGRRVALILDDGHVPVGRPSTVLDLIAEPPLIRRQGPVTAKALAEVLQLQPMIEGQG